VQQKVIQLVVNRIVVEDSRVIIEHVVPTGPVRSKLATTSFTPVRNEADLIPWRRPRRARPVAGRGIVMPDAWAA
jgi:hypothetical protein